MFRTYRKKKTYIDVSPIYEFENMFDLYKVLEYPIPETYRQKVPEAEVESWHMDLQKIREKSGSFLRFSHQTHSILHNSTEHRPNEFSKTTVVVPMGGGILIFCYADFRSAFNHCTAARQELTRTVDNLKEFPLFDRALFYP